MRGPKREVISRCYNLIVRTVLGSHFSDAQCGFKAVRTDAARALLPRIEDDEWFFDTELLVLAERCGLRIHEVAVDWVDGPDSRVDIAQTAAADLKGIGRLLRGFATGRDVEWPAGSLRPPFPGSELASFARIGVVSTVAWLALWLALRPALGSFTANAIALGICSVPNTAANLRVTFGGRRDVRRQDQVMGGLAVLAASLVATSFALAVAVGLSATSAAAEVVALLLANGLVAFILFVLLRAWVVRGRAPHETADLGSAES